MKAMNLLSALSQEEKETYGRSCGGLVDGRRSDNQGDYVFSESDEDEKKGAVMRTKGENRERGHTASPTQSSPLEIDQYTL